MSSPNVTNPTLAGSPPIDNPAAALQETPTPPTNPTLDLSPEHNTADPWTVLGKGFAQSTGAVKQNYFNNYAMLRGDLSDDQELELMRNAAKDNFGDLTPDELKAQPWYVRAGVDVEHFGVGLTNIYAAGTATGGAAAVSGLPVSAALSRIPGAGPLLGVSAESGEFASGFTVGSLAAIGTQSTGEMYGKLRLEYGVDRNTSRAISAAYGLTNTGLGLMGVKAANGLAGAAQAVGLQRSLIPLAEQAGVDTESAFARQVQARLLTRLGLAYSQYVVKNTAVGEGSILLQHGALAAAGIVEKQDAGAYTNWGSTGSDMKDNFLQLLAANALIGTHVAGAGYASGTVKTTIGKIINEEDVQQTLKQLKTTDPHEVLNMVQQAANDLPYAHEQNPGEVVHTEDGKLMIQSGTTKTSDEAATTQPETLPSMDAPDPLAVPTTVVADKTGEPVQLDTHSVVKDAATGELSNFTITASKNGVPVGSATFGRFDGDWHPETVRVDEPQRRRGIATEMYKSAEKIIGGPLAPRPNGEGQSPDGMAFRQAYDASKDPLAGTPLGQSQTPATSDETTQALNDIMAPEEDQYAPADAPGRVVESNPLETSEPLTPVEKQARVNQIAADTRILTMEQRRLEATFNRKDKMGHNTTVTLQKLDNILNLKEELQTEHDLLTSGLMDRDEVSGSYGKIRMGILSDQMRKIQRGQDRLEKFRGKYKAALLDQKQKATDALAAQKGTANKAVAKARQTGANVATRDIQSMQKKLTQYINAATKDKSIRVQLRQIVNGVTTPEQFKQAGLDIHDALRKAEQAKIDARNKSAKENLIDEINALLKQAKPKTQSGRPVSTLTADTVRDLGILRGYLKDQTLSQAKQQHLAEAAINDYMATHLNPDDKTSPTYADLEAAGQQNLIPLEDRQNYRLAIMALDFKNRTPMELNIIKGNIAQMIDDARVEVARAHAILQAKRDDENMIAERSIGVGKPIEGNYSPGRKALHGTESAVASLMSWDILQELISPKDPNHEIKYLMDVTPAKRAYNVTQDVVKNALRQSLQDELLKAGFKDDIQKYFHEASETEYRVRYSGMLRGGATYVYKEANFTRAQGIDFIMKLQDDTLHNAMRDSEKGNGWTLAGDVPPGQSFEEVVRSMLKPEDHIIADALMRFYDKDHARLNAFYRKVNGVDLPKVANYSPSAREGHDVPAIGAKRGFMFNTLVPGSAKNRVQNLNAIMLRNAFDIADDHIDDWAHYEAYTDVMGTMQNVFKRNQAVRKAIKDRHGSGTMKVIDDYIDRFADDTPMPQRGVLDPVWAAARGNMSRATLSLRAPIQLMLHMAQTTAMLGLATREGISTGQLASGWLEAAQNLDMTKAAFDASPILKKRYEGAYSFDLNNALHQAGFVETIFAKATGIGDELTLEQHEFMTRIAFEGVRRGAAAAAYIGGVPIFWAEIRRGKTPEQAMMTVERIVESTQQSHDVDQMPYIYANNPFLYTLFGQFHMHVLQLSNHVTQALRDVVLNPSINTVKSFAKQLVYSWVLPGAFQGMVRNAPGYFMPPDSAMQNLPHVALMIGAEGTIGPLNGAPVIGDALESLWWQAAKPLIGPGPPEHNSGSKLYDELYTNPMAAWNAVHKVMHPDDETKGPSLSSSKDHSNDAVKAAYKITKAVAPLTGLPAQVLNAPAGVINAVRHNDWVGAAFALGGWTPSSIQSRYAEEDKQSLPALGAEKAQPLFEQMIQQGYSNGQAAHDESGDTPHNDEFEQALIQGAMNSPEGQ